MNGLLKKKALFFWLDFVFRSPRVCWCGGLRRELAEVLGSSLFFVSSKKKRRIILSIYLPTTMYESCSHAAFTPPPSSNFWLAILYFFLVLLCAFQCWRIIYYKHNLFSYQFGFLLMCLVFATMRCILFLFLCSLKYSIGYDIMYWIPFNIQFATFSLLVTFFAHILKQNKRPGKLGNRPLIVYLISNAIFVACVIAILSLSAAYHDYGCERQGCCECGESCCPEPCEKKNYGCSQWYNLSSNTEVWCTYKTDTWDLDPPENGTCYEASCPCQGEEGKSTHSNAWCCQPHWLVMFGAGTAGTLFLVLDIFIGIYGYRIGQRMNTSPAFQVPFQPKGGDPRKILVITGLIFLIFLSRSIFDFAVVAGVAVIDPSTGRVFDEVINFCLYSLWEITPTTSIIILFWNIPKTEVGLLDRLAKPQITKSTIQEDQEVQTPLFKDRRRYDSDDDESTNFTKGGTSTLYGTPHYPYITCSVAGHSPYPTSTHSPEERIEEQDIESLPSNKTDSSLSFESSSLGSPESPTDWY